MNILVTGALGFVGKNLCAALQNVKDGKDKTHPSLKIEEIFEKFSNKQALFSKLLDMYQYPMETMIDDENSEGNAIAWDPNF